MKYRITMQSTSQDVTPPEVITAEGSSFMGAALNLLKQWENRFTFDNPFAGIFEALAELAHEEGDGTATHFEISEPEAAFTMLGEMLPDETFEPKPNRVLIQVAGGVVQTVHASDPSAEVVVIDYDTDDPQRMKINSENWEQAQTMKEVY